MSIFDADQIVKVANAAVEAAVETAYRAGQRDSEAEWSDFVYHNSCEIGLVPCHGPGERTVAIAFDDFRDGVGEERFVAYSLEALMLDEISKDPHFAVVVAKEMRRVAALTDDIELPPL